ncbi:MAG: tetratricopeptide repeat protein, partial [Chthoniobacteraceae bacterium]
MPQIFRNTARQCGVLRWAMVCALTLVGAQAQTPGEISQAQKLTELQNAALKAFQQGNWGEAASGLEKLIREVPNEMQPQLGSIYMTLGAAYYNIPNFDKAIEVFTGFIAKFPNSERMLDAKLAVGQTYLAAKKFDEAIKMFASLENIAAVRERALGAQALAYKIQKKPDQAIRVLEKLVGADIKTTPQANGAVMLVELYVEKNETAKAAALLEKLQARIAIIDNLVTLNTVAMKLADGFADKKMYGEAIACYRLIRSRDEVIAFQADRIAKIEKAIDYNSRVGPADPALYVKAQQQNNVLKAAVEESKALLAEFSKLPDYAAPMMFRVARCWNEWDKKWESLVVYKQLLLKFPKAEEREPVMFDVVATLGDLNRIKSTQAAC